MYKSGWKNNPGEYFTMSEKCEKRVDSEQDYNFLDILVDKLAKNNFIDIIFLQHNTTVL